MEVPAAPTEFQYITLRTDWTEPTVETEAANDVSGDEDLDVDAVRETTPLARAPDGRRTGIGLAVTAVAVVLWQLCRMVWPRNDDDTSNHESSI